MRIVGVVVGGLVSLLVLGWVILGNDLAQYKVFAPRYEQVRRETFEQSKAYRQGVAQEVARAYQDYQRATPEQRAAIAAVVRHQTADVDEASLPPDLRAFVRSLR